MNEIMIVIAAQDKMVLLSVVSHLNKDDIDGALASFENSDQNPAITRSQTGRFGVRRQHRSSPGTHRGRVNDPSGPQLE